MVADKQHNTSPWKSHPIKQYIHMIALLHLYKCTFHAINTCLLFLLDGAWHATLLSYCDIKYGVAPSFPGHSINVP